MKKGISVLAVFLFIFSSSIQAQDEVTNVRIFKPFKVDVSLGYAIPQTTQGTGRNAGAIFAIEPKYAVMDELSIGIRFEGAAMANIGDSWEIDNAQVNASYLATGDYYFSNKKFRPFLGAGAGVYTYAFVDSDNDYETIDDVPTISNFGFMARGGFELSHLRLGVEYNFVQDKSGYLGLKLGVVIGGGRK